jgi:hypothetical protein
MSNISKWFGKAIYITALDNFEELNKDLVPLINNEVVPTNSQYARNQMNYNLLMIMFIMMKDSKSYLMQFNQR